MNKLAIITGANTGLGYETAKALLMEGYDVLMANRSAEKSRKAVARLMKLGCPGTIDYALLDLEDRQSIRAFVDGFKTRYGRFDVLVNNAGILLPEMKRSSNDLELHFDVNYLGHFLLNSLLLRYMKADGLVVSVSSLAHKMEIADIHFDDLSFDRQDYGKMKAYSQSKLAMALYGVELARRFDGGEKRSLIAHPGVSNTDIIASHVPLFLSRMLMPVVRLFGITGPAEGARPIIHAILTEGLPNGAYIGPCGRKEWNGKPGICSLSEKALDEPMAIRLWRKSEELLDIEFEV